MKKILIVVDMQKDFVDGALGSKEAAAIVPAAVQRIQDFEGEIFVTLDTHFASYLDSAEGRKLPVPHCVKDTEGWQLNGAIQAALEGKRFTAVEKHSFGSMELPRLIRDAVGKEPCEIELLGLCTDICVVSNALILKAAFPEAVIAVDEACCAGVTPDGHRAALKVMESCQIDIH